MSRIVDVAVPDIGDFENVPVIEVMVAPGDVIAKDDSLIALESEKATMEVPAPFAGTVKALRVKPGDKVSKGSLILTLDVEADAQSTPAPAPTPSREAASAPAQAA